MQINHLPWTYPGGGHLPDIFFFLPSWFWARTPHLGNICIVVSPLDPRQSLTISEPVDEDHLWELIARTEIIQLTHQ